MLRDELINFWDKTLDFLPDLVISLLILAGFVVLGKVLRKGAEKALLPVSKQASIARLIARIVYVITVIIGVLFALRALNLDGVVTSVLAGAGIIGLALGFAFQDIASNLIAGVVMSMQKQFNAGDLVQVNETFGIVQRVELRSTIIKTLEGQIVYVPNVDIFTNKVVDYTQMHKRRVDIGVGVSYGDDLEKAEKVTLDAVKNIPLVIESEPIELFYEEFSDSSINFTVRFWITFKKEPDYLDARSQAIKSIKKAFDKHDITIPFPIRTLDFDAPVGSTRFPEHLKVLKKK